MSFSRNLWEIVKFAIIALLIVMPIRLWIAQPFIVSGSSMEPAFENGDYLIVDELTYRFKEPQRDDVVIFRYPLKPSTFFIKRIVGLPGEIMKMNGKEILLGEDEYFVLGDNRAVSKDSRRWGALKKDFMIGRAFLRLWPINKSEFLPGN